MLHWHITGREATIEQLLNGVEQNIVICQQQADQLFAKAKAWSK